jgi:type IV pilus assembly protein PilO
MSGVLQKAVFFLLLIGLVFSGYHFMIRPANQDLVLSRQRVEANLGKLNEFETATTAAEDISKQLSQLHDAIAFFESKLPPTNEIYRVLEHVTVIAQKQGLKPKSIKTLNRKHNSGYVEQPLCMKLEGDFNAFYSFLLELEKLPRIMKVRKLNLDKKAALEGLVAADCIVSIFFQNKVG